VSDCICLHAIFSSVRRSTFHVARNLFRNVERTQENLDRHVQTRGYYSPMDWLLCVRGRSFHRVRVLAVLAGFKFACELPSVLGIGPVKPAAALAGEPLQASQPACMRDCLGALRTADKHPRDKNQCASEPYLQCCRHCRCVHIPMPDPRNCRKLN
jgi:hypothetical protein